MPKVNLYGSLKLYLEDDKELKISITHSRDYAACVAIIQKKS
jgi:phosphopantetheinyl transferase (holo-ACP synthase)